MSYPSTSEDGIPSYLTGEIIRVLVGRKRKRYQIHANLLSSSSSYFKARIYPFRGIDSSRMKTRVELPDTDSTIFELVINWLYHRRIPTLSTGSEETAKALVKTYIAVYLSASDWEMSCLQKILDLLHSAATIDSDWSTFTISAVYQYTNSSSPLRSLFLDLFIAESYSWDCEYRRWTLRQHIERGNHEFVLDFSEALAVAAAAAKDKSIVNLPVPDSGNIHHEAPVNESGCIQHEKQDTAQETAHDEPISPVELAKSLKVTMRVPADKLRLVIGSPSLKRKVTPKRRKRKKRW